MEEARLLDAHTTLLCYQRHDAAGLSGAAGRAWQQARIHPDAKPELLLRLVVSTDLQHLGLAYKKPELQQIAIALLSSETNRDFLSLTENALDCIQTIVP